MDKDNVYNPDKPFTNTDGTAANDDSGHSL